MFFLFSEKVPFGKSFAPFATCTYSSTSNVRLDPEKKHANSQKAARGKGIQQPRTKMSVLSESIDLSLCRQPVLLSAAALWDGDVPRTLSPAEKICSV